jgi:aspartyl-tRNA(Asn)/glutamyl-tRNA(Gln) amidotransferase subunit B
MESDLDKAMKLANNYTLTELKKHLMEQNEDIRDILISEENFAELIAIVADGKINSSAAQAVLEEMYRTGSDPSNIIEEKNLAQMSNEDELGDIVDQIIKNNEKSAKDYKEGKENALQFLMGQVMRETKGKANPQVVIALLRKRL